MVAARLHSEDLIESFDIPGLLAYMCTHHCICRRCKFHAGQEGVVEKGDSIDDGDYWVDASVAG